METLCILISDRSDVGYFYAKVERKKRSILIWGQACLLFEIFIVYNEYLRRRYDVYLSGGKRGIIVYNEYLR